jgi:hypothetical protein
MKAHIHGRSIGSEGAADAIGQHVEIVITPLAGRARGRGALQDEVILLFNSLRLFPAWQAFWNTGVLAVLFPYEF